MTRRYRQRAGTWGAAANGCGACGTFPAPAADRSPRRGHLNAERSDGAARHGAAPLGRAAAAPRGGWGGRAGLSARRHCRRGPARRLRGEGRRDPAAAPGPRNSPAIPSRD